MSRTDLDPATLAASLRRMAGDGSVEWVTEPIQTRVLLDVADMLNENAKLRDLCEWLLNPYRLGAVTGEGVDKQWCRETYDGGSYRLRELGIEVPD